MYAQKNVSTGLLFGVGLALISIAFSCLVMILLPRLSPALQIEIK